MNILFAASEAAPFCKTGGLADVAGSLPKALSSESSDVRVILPLYGSISQEWRDKMEYLMYTYVQLAWRRQYCGVFTLDHDGVVYYFLDNEYYFNRDSLYGCYDDGERFGFFSKAVADILPMLGWRPDIVHCNDWQTALIPIYLRMEASDFYKGIKSVFTIHNIEYQGRFNEFTLEDVFGLPRELFDSGVLRYENDVDLMKGAIYKADFVTTVSPSYARELCDPYFAHGLHKVMADNAYKTAGIINGLDTKRYDPAKDPFIAKGYSARSMKGKADCKTALCRELGFDESDDSPIISCVSRLAEHKGMELVASSLDEIMNKGLRMVVLGTGEARYENWFRDAEYRYRGRFSACIMYSEKRASMVYAGSDMFLMPSKSEPCGLSQLIAMRYGALPIVHDVGGLKDTVRAYPEENANGFKFGGYDAGSMLGAIDFALETMTHAEVWTALKKTAMKGDYTWKSSAAEYLSIYKQLLS